MTKKPILPRLMRYSYGPSNRMVPSCLLSRKTWASGPAPKRRSAREAGVLPCSRFFSRISWSKVLVSLSSFSRILPISWRTPWAARRRGHT